MSVVLRHQRLLLRAFFLILMQLGRLLVKDHSVGLTLYYTRITRHLQMILQWVIIDVQLVLIAVPTGFMLLRGGIR